MMHYTIALCMTVLIINNSQAQVLQSKCGLKGNSVPNEIPGKAVQPSEYPWLALLGFPDGDVYTIRCVGALINTKYVISSAWCHGSRPTSKPSHARLGEYDIRAMSSGSNPPPVDYYIINHVTPGYTSITEENDIALNELDRPVVYTDNIRPACLPYGLENVLFDNNELFMVGYSTHGEYRRFRHSRRKTSVPIGDKFVVMNLEDCQYAYNDSDISITEKNICVGGPGSSTCASLKDGPLHYYDAGSGKYKIIGLLTSRPFGCNETEPPKQPAVFTKLTEFLPFIEKNSV